MSTSLLYHAFGIQNYLYTSTRYEGGATIFTAKPNPDKLRCPNCGTPKIVRKGTTVRKFRMEPIGSRRSFLEAIIQRVLCLVCGIIRQCDLPFADSRRAYTKRFERYALELSQHMTIQNVSQHLGVVWDVIKEIKKRHLSKKYKKPRLKDLKWLAIDEIHIGYGYRFFTVVMDLETGAVVFVGDGKGADALTPFWKRLRHSKAMIQAVAMDMGAAFNLAVRTNLPEATIVTDHFHLIKLFNEKVTGFRRELQREAEEKGKQVFKGMRWLLLKKPVNLDEGRNEAARLHEALKLNAPLATVYYMKEDLGRIWRQMDKECAEFWLDDWVKRAKASGIGMLNKFAKTLVRHKDGILAYYDFGGMSSGKLEGMNNKIGLLQRKSYGFRDLEFFKLKIMDLHKSRVELVG
jgi:transposase